MHNLWKKWGGSITAILSALAFLGAIIFTFGASFNRLDSINSDITHIQDKLLPDLDARLDTVHESLVSIQQTVRPTEGSHTLPAISGFVKELQQEHIDIRELLASLNIQHTVKGELERQSHEDFKESQTIQYGELRESIMSIQSRINEMNKSISRMEEFIDIMRPIVTKNLALGRIKIDDVTKIYGPGDVQQFLEDAESLFPIKGGGGGGNSQFMVAQGGLKPSTGDCTGAPLNCAFVSFNNKYDPYSKEGVRIDFLYNMTPEEVLAIKDTFYQEDRLASLRNHDGRLCTWVGKLLYG